MSWFSIKYNGNTTKFTFGYNDWINQVRVWLKINTQHLHRFFLLYRKKSKYKYAFLLYCRQFAFFSSVKFFVTSPLVDKSYCTKILSYNNYVKNYDHSSFFTSTTTKSWSMTVSLKNIFYTDWRTLSSIIFIILIINSRINYAITYCTSARGWLSVQDLDSV